MATLHWTKGNTNFLTGFGGTIHATDDSLHFDDDGFDAVTAGLDQSAKAVHVLEFSPSSGVEVGSPGAPLLITSTQTGAGKGVRYFGRGRNLYLGAGGSAAALYRVVHSPAASCRLTLSAADIEELVVEGGVAHVPEGVDLATLYAQGGEVILDYSASYALGTLWGGQCLVRLRRDVGTVYVGAGMTLVVDDYRVSPTTIYQLGGEIIYAGGDIGTLVGIAGRFTRVAASRAITITTLRASPSWAFNRGPVATAVSAANPIGVGPRSEVV